MSVYTSISKAQLIHFLKNYSIGELIHFSGIQAGIQNTNYKIKTQQGEFILTLYETLTITEIPDFLALLKQLASQQFPTPEPKKNKAGKYLNPLKGKQATLFNCLPGRSTHNPTSNQCEEIGGFLAQLHKQPNPHIKHINPSNISEYKRQFNQVKSILNPQDTILIETELQNQSTNLPPNLPNGLIHADLFKDNVLFDQGHISGLLDFYNACHGVFIFDIAVTINDWCFENNSINLQKYKALISGYQKQKTLTNEELHYLPQYLRLTALRFWLSRLAHHQQAKSGELTLTKDPSTFQRILEFHQLTPQL